MHKYRCSKVYSSSEGSSNSEKELSDVKEIEWDNVVKTVLKTFSQERRRQSLLLMQKYLLWRQCQPKEYDLLTRHIRH